MRNLILIIALQSFTISAQSIVNDMECFQKQGAVNCGMSFEKLDGSFIYYSNNIISDELNKKSIIFTSYNKKLFRFIKKELKSKGMTVKRNKEWIYFIGNESWVLSRDERVITIIVYN